MTAKGKKKKKKTQQDPINEGVNEIQEKDNPIMDYGGG